MIYISYTPHDEQELDTIPEHLRSLPVYSGVRQQRRLSKEIL
jgi:hypothetical protein